MTAVTTNGVGISESVELTESEQVMVWSCTRKTINPKQELLMSGLRTIEGVSLSQLEMMSKASINSVLDLKKISEYTSQGFLSMEGDRLVATRKGRSVLDSILPEILN